MAEALIRPQATGGAVLSSFDLETFDFLDTLEMDLTSSEDYTTAAEWTQHPVEDGADITDNASLQLDKVTLSGIITQTPIVGGDASVDRLAQADEILQRLVKRRQPLQVITGLRVLDGYVATNLTVSRSQTTGQTFNLTIDLQELRTVEAQFTEVPPAPVRADKKAEAGAAVDGGTKAPVETTPEAEAGPGAAPPATDADGDPVAEEDEPNKSVAAKSYDAALSSIASLTGGG